MIGSLTGTVTTLLIDKSSIILTVQGVGYLVYTPSQTLASIRTGAELSLYTHLAVRETALDLYGFTTLDEKHFFEILIGISGVGPKSALSILSLADVPTLHNAIAENNTDYLTKVSGIGKKLAQKIVLELKDKIGTVELTGTQSHSDDASVIEALEAMGYKQAEAREVVKQLDPEVHGLNARVAAALKHINA
jgi:Holliday junction DNA helicase RuvA